MSVEKERVMVHRKSNRIPESELLAYRAEVKGEIFRQIRQRLSLLQEDGFTQKDLADRLGMDPGLLSRRLKGEQDMRLETLSDLGRGLGCRIDVSLVPLTQVFASTVNQAPAQAFSIQHSDNGSNLVLGTSTNTLSGTGYGSNLVLGTSTNTLSGTGSTDTGNSINVIGTANVSDMRSAVSFFTTGTNFTDTGNSINVIGTINVSAGSNARDLFSNSEVSLWNVFSWNNNAWQQTPDLVQPATNLVQRYGGTTQ
jgi:transcriptional regulator with XRE-family HTH domain